jgi:hypothetical protein
MKGQHVARRATKDPYAINTVESLQVQVHHLKVQLNENRVEIKQLKAAKHKLGLFHEAAMKKNEKELAEMSACMRTLHERLSGPEQRTAAAEVPQGKHEKLPAFSAQGAADTLWKMTQRVTLTEQRAAESDAKYKEALKEAKLWNFRESEAMQNELEGEVRRLKLLLQKQRSNTDGMMEQLRALKKGKENVHPAATDGVNVEEEAANDDKKDDATDSDTPTRVQFAEQQLVKAEKLAEEFCACSKPALSHRILACKMKLSALQKMGRLARQQQSSDDPLATIGQPKLPQARSLASGLYINFSAQRLQTELWEQGQKLAELELEFGASGDSGDNGASGDAVDATGDADATDAGTPASVSANASGGSGNENGKTMSGAEIGGTGDEGGERMSDAEMVDAARTKLLVWEREAYLLQKLLRQIERECLQQAKAQTAEELDFGDSGEGSGKGSASASGGNAAAAGVAKVLGVVRRKLHDATERVVCMVQIDMLGDLLIKADSNGSNGSTDDAASHELSPGQSGQSGQYGQSGQGDEQRLPDGEEEAGAGSGPNGSETNGSNADLLQQAIHLAYVLMPKILTR